jgi:hypothetical protein
LRAYPFPSDMGLEEVLRTVGRMYLEVMAIPENRDLIHLLLTVSAHDSRRAELYLSQVWDNGIKAFEDAIAERLPASSPASAHTISMMISSSLSCHVIHSEALAAVAGRPLENNVDPSRWEYLDEIVRVIARGVGCEVQS